ncbi:MULTISPECIES: S8 family peptidase [Microvirga]|uniref:S8 family peptidase n=1 Tax=Microvirga TaxID=186650 RepID=UPI0016872E31|nr:MULTISPECIES: S8 family serine peptidase [Microvirga]MBD2749855.1 S8 family serine peptidase [Microvirga sp.]
MRYLLVPKVDDLGDSLASDTTSMQPAARARRVEALVRARQAVAIGDRRLDEFVLQQRASEAPFAPRVRPRTAPADDAMGGNINRDDEEAVVPPGISVLATPAHGTPVTGITVLEAEPEAKDALGEAFPDHDVVEDFALELIAPPLNDALAENGGGGASSVTEAELWHLRDIGLLAARRRGFGLTGDGIVIGVLDTGVADVPELSGRILENRVFDPTNLDYKMADLVADTDWHGTHVAGLIAGRSVGVAPGSKIVSLTMIPNRVGSFSHYVFALEHAQARPEVQILNISAGKSGQHPQMRNMARIAQRLDVLCVMAIGNSGVNTNCSPGNYPEVISVGASDSRGRVWTSSSGGAITWDGMQHSTPTLVAPGVDVVSSLPDGSYRAESGTSMATPIVTGIAALLIEKHPDITVRQLHEEILSACVSLDLDVGRQGAGVLRLPPSLLIGLPREDVVAGVSPPPRPA